MSLRYRIYQINLGGVSRALLHEVHFASFLTLGDAEGFLKQTKEAYKNNPDYSFELRDTRETTNAAA